MLKRVPDPGLKRYNPDFSDSQSQNLNETKFRSPITEQVNHYKHLRFK